jgi:magnesium chelatase family protein
VSRAARQAEFPARFQLIAAMNPCPCGYLGHYSAKCHCTPEQVARYRRRISGPLLDRIDLHVEVPAVPPDELSGTVGAEPSASMTLRTSAARDVQISRQHKPNAYLSTREVEQHARTDTQGEVLLKQAISRLGLSARGYHRILKVARTIADLAASQTVCAEHVAESIQYRRMDRN